MNTSWKKTPLYATPCALSSFASQTHNLIFHVPWPPVRQDSCQDIGGVTCIRAIVWNGQRVRGVFLNFALCGFRGKCYISCAQDISQNCTLNDPKFFVSISFACSLPKTQAAQNETTNTGNLPSRNCLPRPQCTSLPSARFAMTVSVPYVQEQNGSLPNWFHIDFRQNTLQ